MYAVMKTVESSGFFEERVMRIFQEYSDAQTWLDTLVREKMKQGKYNDFEIGERKFAFSDVNRKVEIYIRKVQVCES